MRLVFKCKGLPRNSALVEDDNKILHLLHYDTEIMTIDMNNLDIIQVKRCSIDSFKAQYAVCDYLGINQDTFRELVNKEPKHEFHKYGVGEY